MLYSEQTSNGTFFAKDPCVVRFLNKFFLYFSKMGQSKLNHEVKMCIGIAVSDDMENWQSVGEIWPEQQAEGHSICAPGGIVLDGVLHLFYQSYGQYPKDYICHATSNDGLHFTRDKTNPIVMPEGDWNNGRAIDADVLVFKDQLLLYWATRDPNGIQQMIGVSSAPIESDFSASNWTQRCAESILKPELQWEQDCIEAPATCMWNEKVYMFYGGAYNCKPQQIGCAVSQDGIHFERLSKIPLLTNGIVGSWNASESGHPYIFEYEGEYHLFYQGSSDMGKNWYLSRAVVYFENGFPQIIV